MRHLPKDDERLVDFLRQNFPPPPAASSDLEAQILKSIALLPTECDREALTPNLQRRLWRVPPLSRWGGAIVAASLLAAWTGYRLLAPQSPSSAELMSLEAFVETNWNGVVSDTPPVEPVFEWFFSAQPTSKSEGVAEAKSQK